MVFKEELVKDATKIRSSGTRTSSLRKRDRRVQIDGGWGWVVTFAAFMVSFILDGIAYSFGLFFTELLEYFGETKSLTAWIISIFNGTYMFIGMYLEILFHFFACMNLPSCTSVYANGASTRGLRSLTTILGPV